LICKRPEHIELYVKPQTYQRWIHDGTQVRALPPHHVSEVGILDHESNEGPGDGFGNLFTISYVYFIIIHC